MKNTKFKRLLILLLVILAYSCKTNQEDKPVNFIFILADDLGYAQSGCYGSEYYTTPNIDKLAREGMRFTNAYAACPVCSPTRASIITGKYPARLHITDFIAGNKRDDYPLSQPDWQKFLPLEEVTFAELLKQNGYQTALFGKWHLSKEKTPPESLPFNPDKQGFDETFVTYKPSGNMEQPWQQPEIDGHNVDTITRLATEFLERNQTKPFFLFVSHNSIHDPLMEKQETIEKYKKRKGVDKRENHAVIAAMIERLDKSCGTIFNKVNELGLEENTVIIFFSDNGGRDLYAKQTPLRSGKGWIYEGGIREPLIVKWKDKFRAGTLSESLISSIDFYPTFLDLAGINENPENIDGKSFLPVLNNPKIEIHDNLFWHYPHYHAGSGMMPASAVRSGRYKLIEWHEPLLIENQNAWELFDLENDIGEKQNLCDSLPEKVKELKLVLTTWRSEVNAQMPQINKNATPKN
ncbi:sulfatase [Maribellus maritimus]|uniref:sulfatase n=1 Tax=Maribellus maritimus TaxID=2870838 RepID=UPI001EEA960F|nr:sulfatase [Maribellus maritimus]MCG6187012.1 sulfatase [Maribellus maritimus]